MKNWTVRALALSQTAMILVKAGCMSDALDGSNEFNLSIIAVH